MARSGGAIYLPAFLTQEKKGFLPDFRNPQVSFTCRRGKVKTIFKNFENIL